MEYQHTETKCPRCGYHWIYKGRSIYYVCCPMCRKSFKLDKDCLMWQDSIDIRRDLSELKQD